MSLLRKWCRFRRNILKMLAEKNVSIIFQFFKAVKRNGQLQASATLIPEVNPPISIQ
jgi:hypothetical protein